MRSLSIAEARNRLPGIVHDVETGPPVELTRHGKPVAVVLSVRGYSLLVDGRGGFAKALAAFRDRTEANGAFLTDADLAGLRDPSPGRSVLTE